MKIIVDPQIFLIQTYGGISRYYTEIFKRISKYENTEVKIPIIFTNNIYINDSQLITENHSFKKMVFTLLKKMGISTRKKIKKSNQKLLDSVLQKEKFDLFIPTYFNSYFLPKINDTPFVLTVYDMIHELFPQYFENDTFEVVKYKKELIHKATKIIAVSENTKKDILKIYPSIDQNKIKVIYHGNSIQVNHDIQINVPGKYILFVGSRDNYKNFKLLTESIKSLLVQDSNLFLICAGGGKFNSDEESFLVNMGLQKKVLQLSFDENQLGKIYNKARCFVFPSEYEGFGIPVLEAMACQCPIILTNNSSFPEVAGNAGLFFKLNDKIDLKNKIKSIIDDEALREKHIKLGNEQIKLFNWEEKAAQCYSLYQEATKN